MQPHWIDEYMVSDERFAAAYNTLSPRRMGWIKKNISQVYAWSGLERTISSRTTHLLDNGAEILEFRKKMDWVLYYLDAQFLTASSLVVAAVLPSRMAGIEDIIVTSAPERSMGDALLTGLELTGSEQVFELSSDKISQLIGEKVKNSGAGIVLGLGADASGLIPADFFKDVSPFQLTHPLAAHVWMDQDTQWNWEEIQFALPGTDIRAFGEKREVPDYVSHISGEWDTMMEESPDVLFVPRNKASRCIDVSRHVRSPGQESCWIWPHLTREFFQKKHMGLADTLCG